jgi:hypothetical protein
MVEERDTEHRVIPLEPFFDLVFVFAFTPVMTLFVHDSTRVGAGSRGALVGVDRVRVLRAVERFGQRAEWYEQRFGS